MMMIVLMSSTTRTWETEPWRREAERRMGDIYEKACRQAKKESLLSMHQQDNPKNKNKRALEVLSPQRYKCTVRTMVHWHGWNISPRGGLASLSACSAQRPLEGRVCRFSFSWLQTGSSDFDNKRTTLFLSMIRVLISRSSFLGWLWLAVTVRLECDTTIDGVGFPEGSTKSSSLSLHLSFATLYDSLNWTIQRI